MIFRKRIQNWHKTFGPQSEQTIGQLSHKNLTSEGWESQPAPELPQESFTGQKARRKPVGTRILPLRKQTPCPRQQPLPETAD